MYKDTAIIIAWPDTLCKKPGSWYDVPLAWLKINRNNYYRVGHAAIVLVKSNHPTCHYFDFGRYHSPFQFGRVRSAYTDHDLEIKTRATFSEGKLNNVYEILNELYTNKSCHGTGKLIASTCEINFETAFEKASQMQKQSPIKYGPFIPNGTNCSRFVNSVARAGEPRKYEWWKLYLPLSFSPTPSGNVNVFNNTFCIESNGNEVSNNIELNML